MKAYLMLVTGLLAACSSRGNSSVTSGGGGARASDAAPSSVASVVDSTSPTVVSSSSGTMTHPICMEYATTYCNCFAMLLMKPQDVCVSDTNNACETSFMQCAASGQTPTQEIQCQIDTMNSTNCDPDKLASACNNIPSCS